MNAADANSSIEGRDDENPGPRHREKSTATPAPAARTTWILALAGTMAALVSWGVGEAFYEVIPAQPVLQNISGNQVMIPNMATESVATIRNAALAFGISGLCLAGFMGVAGGLARRSIPATIRAGLVGSILGFILGAALCLGLLPFIIKARYDYFEYELAISFAMHGVIWGSIGACAGLTFALGLRRSGFMVKAIFAGFSGALLGSLIYEILGAAVFSMAETSLPVSNAWHTRLLAQLFLSVMTAAFLAVVAKPRSPKPSRANP